MSFNSPDGNLEQIFISDYSVIDEFGTVGTLWSWGDNGSGQLGDNTIVNKSSPVQTIDGGTDWKSVSISWDHSSAIKTDGSLWAWGDNNDGELGDNTITHRSSPVHADAGGSDWKSVSCGNSYTTAIKTDDTLWSSGVNNNGQLGDNTITYRSSPVPIAGGGTNWKLISAGWDHNIALKTDGTLWSWGRNDSGQLGDNTITHRSSPVPITGGGTNWKLISGGGYHSAAIKTDGTLWSWGHNNSGQLGDNTITHRSSPIQTVTGGTNWKFVDCGISDYTAAITYDAAPIRPELAFLGSVTGTSGTTLSLTSLALQPGDLVVGWSAIDAVDKSSRPTPSNGWTSFISAVYDTYTNSYAIYKIMTSTLDTIITLKIDSTDGVMMACAFRGLDPIHPVVDSSIIDASLNPGSLTTTANGFSLCFPLIADASTMSSTMPTVWTIAGGPIGSTSGYDAVTTGAYRQITSGTYNPTAFTCTDSSKYIAAAHIIFRQ